MIMEFCMLLAGVYSVTQIKATKGLKNEILLKLDNFDNLLLLSINKIGTMPV